MELSLRRLLAQERLRFTDDNPALGAINQQYAFWCHDTRVTAGAILQCLTAADHHDTLFTLAQHTGQEAALFGLVDAVVTYVNQHHPTPPLPEPGLIFGKPEACARHRQQLQALVTSLFETLLLPLAEMGYYDHGRGAVLIQQRAPWVPCAFRYLSQDAPAPLASPTLIQQLAPLIATYTPQQQAVVGILTGPWLWGEVTDAFLLAYPKETAHTDRLTIYEAWVQSHLPGILSCAAASQVHRRRGVVLMRPLDDTPGRYELGWLGTTRFPPDPDSDLAACVQTYAPERELVVLAIRHWASSGSRWGTGAVVVLDLESGRLRQRDTRGTPRGPAVFLPQMRLF